jgi:hypothetical protein
MAYDPQNSGELGKNKSKAQESHPDYSGKITVEGKQYWLNGWLKTNRETGEKFFSLSVKPKDSNPSKAKSKANDFMGDDLSDAPF